MGSGMTGISSRGCGVRGHQRMNSGWGVAHGACRCRLVGHLVCGRLVGATCRY